MKAIAAALRTLRKGGTPRKWLEATVSASARTRIGHEAGPELRPEEGRTSRTGAVRTIQKAGPSAETAGNTKRTATAEVTKAAMARFTKA